jgi:hypothetical protein
MHAACPVCGLKFEREQGYFLGAMYVSYAVSVPVVLGLVATFWLAMAWPYDLALLAAFVAYLPFVPFVARFARVVWIHVDRTMDPDG